MVTVSTHPSLSLWTHPLQQGLGHAFQRAGRDGGWTGRGGWQCLAGGPRAARLCCTHSSMPQGLFHLQRDRHRSHSAAQQPWLCPSPTRLSRPSAQHSAQGKPLGDAELGWGDS